MHAAEIRRAVADAPRLNLPKVARLLWEAFADGHVSEAEAGSLQAEIEERQSGALLQSQDAPAARRSRAGSRPRTDASMERRRRWSASGRLPPALAGRFTLAEHAVLAVIAAETVKRGDCRLALEQIAAVAGVSRSTVKNALQGARRHGLITIEERRAAAWRNLSNIVRIVSPEWTAWLRMAKSRALPYPIGRGGGGKCLPTTSTKVLDLGIQRKRKPDQHAGIASSGERCVA